MLLVSGCKGNHFFRNAKTFSGKICIRLQKSCKSDAPAAPPRLHTVATAPPDGCRHSGARRRTGATPPPGHATGPVFRLPQGPFGTPAAAVLQARPTCGRKTAVAQRVARQAEGRNNHPPSARLRPRRPPAHAMPTATPPDTPEPPQNGLAHAPAMHLLPERFASVAHLL